MKFSSKFLWEKKPLSIYKVKSAEFATMYEGIKLVYFAHLAIF